MPQPPIRSGITFTQYSPWIWHVWLDSKRVGTVSGDRVTGFTARDMHYDYIGGAHPSPEAAMQAWVPLVHRH